MKSGTLYPYQRSADQDRAVTRLTRNIFFTLTLKSSLKIGAIWCFVWGAVALSMRLFSVVPRHTLIYGVLGLVPAIVSAIVLSRKNLPDRSALFALLDRRNYCGGLLMASDDVDVGEWRSKMPEIDLPRVRWRNRQAWSLFLLSLVFVALCLFLPISLASVNPSRSLEVGREVNDLAGKIDELKEEKLIDQAKADELKQKLDQLANESFGEDPAKTWEALDNLTDAIAKTEKEAAESALSKQQKVAEAENLAEGLITDHDRMDPKMMAESMQALNEMLKGAMEENQMLAENLSPDLQQAIKSGKSGSLSKEQLKDIAGALKQSREALNQKLSKQAQKGTIDPKSLKGGASAGKRDNSGLAQFLKENTQRMSLEDAIKAWSERPGKGGVDRGRGDAAMTWTDGSSEKDAKFKEKALPPSAIAGLKDSQLMGLSYGAPTVEAGLAAHGSLNNAATGGGSAYTQTILPRHRGAVKRYFDRQK